MTNSYQSLIEALNSLTNGQIITATYFLENVMSDKEFEEIPVLSVTEGEKKVLSSYAVIIDSLRKNGKGEKAVHRVYCFFPMIFRLADTSDEVLKLNTNINANNNIGQPDLSAQDPC